LFIAAGSAEKSVDDHSGTAIDRVPLPKPPNVNATASSFVTFCAVNGTQ
jgi:hypothetical protein